MDIASPSVHRALAYLVAVDRQGYSPIGEELESYATQPDLRPARRETIWAAATAPLFRNWIGMLDHEIEASETMEEHFLRLHWATLTESSRLRPSALGRAVERALDQQSDTSDSVSDVVLDAGDPIALERVLAKLAAAGPAMLVDPYFRIDVLVQVLGQTAVTRVLTSERVGANDRETLRSAVEKMVPDRLFEVRVASREVHDRHLIPDSGPVQFIGSSLNGLGKAATVIGTIPDASNAIRSVYEDIWLKSSVLALIQPESNESENEDEDQLQ